MGVCAPGAAGEHDRMAAGAVVARGDDGLVSAEHPLDGARIEVRPISSTITARSTSAPRADRPHRR